MLGPNKYLEGQELEFVFGKQWEIGTAINGDDAPMADVLA
jgi:hypothetical protein